MRPLRSDRWLPVDTDGRACCTDTDPPRRVTLHSRPRRSAAKSAPPAVVSPPREFPQQIIPLEPQVLGHVLEDRAQRAHTKR